MYQCLACLWCLLISSAYSVPVSDLSVVSPGLLPLPTVYQCLACLWCLLASFLSLPCTSVWSVCGVSWSPSSPYSVPVCGVSWSPSSPYSAPVSGLSVVSPGLLSLPTVYQCLACLWCLLVSFLSLQCTSVCPVCGVSWSLSSPYSVPVSGLSAVSPGLLPLPTVYQCLACLWCLLVSFLSPQCTSVWPVCGVSWSPFSPYSVPVSGLSVVSPGLLSLPTVYQCLACLWCLLVSFLSLQCTSVWPVCGVSWSPSSPHRVPVQCLTYLWCLLVSFLSLQCTSVWPVCGVSWSPSSPYSVPVSGLSVVSPGLLSLPTVYQCLACLWCLLVCLLSLPCTSV